MKQKIFCNIVASLGLMLCAKAIGGCWVLLNAHGRPLEAEAPRLSGSVEMHIAAALSEVRFFMGYFCIAAMMFLAMLICGLLDNRKV